MNVERDILTAMFEGDLELAKDFNRVGELRCARGHLELALAKLDQIAALEGGTASPRAALKSQIINLES